MSIFTILIAIIVLSIVILIHELGHFIFCKLFGVKVEEFGIGFPPRAVKLFKKSGTLYSLNWIPFGGFNRILGEEQDSGDTRAYNNQSAWRRLAIASGGIILGVITCWLLLTVWFLILPKVSIPNYVAIVQVLPDTPAEKAGLKANDFILSIDEKQIKNVKDLNSFTTAHRGREVTVILRHQGKKVEQKVVLSSDEDAPLGVSLAETGGDIPELKWFQTPWEALKEMFWITWVTVTYLAQAIASLFGGPKVAFEITGPIGAVAFISQATFLGWVFLIRLAAVISLALAIFNILPIPAADGGKIVFLTMEAMFSKKIIKPEVENVIHAVGFLVLILLSVVIAYLDIMRLI